MVYIEVCGKMDTWGLCDVELIGRLFDMESDICLYSRFPSWILLVGFGPLFRTVYLCFTPFFVVSSLADREDLENKLWGRRDPW